MPINSRSRPKPASTPKIPRQLMIALSWPPSTGAITGASPEIKISREKKMARVRPS